MLSHHSLKPVLDLHFFSHQNDALSDFQALHDLSYSYYLPLQLYFTEVWIFFYLGPTLGSSQPSIWMPAAILLTAVLFDFVPFFE